MSMVKTFDARVSALGAADSQTVASILTAAADVALVVDGEGIIRDLHLGTEPALDEARDWLGREWVETVTPESRRKVEQLLREARGEEGASRRRQVNHAFASGTELPVAYTAVRMGTGGGVVAVGRDLRAVAALQQRLVQAQQAMERDYWRMRHVETRYRLLFQLSGEAVLLVDAGTRKVVDANPAAARVLGTATRQLVGRPFALGGEGAERDAVQRHLDEVRGRGEGEPVAVRVGDETYQLAAALVPQDGSALYLVRLLPDGTPAAAVAGAGGSRVVRALQASPDGFAVVDPEGKVLGVNGAFLQLAELASEDQARGERIHRWIGRPGADADGLLGIVREHGVARLFATTLRGEYGATAEVEVSAAAAQGDEPCVGLSIRDVGRRLSAAPTGARDLTRAVEDLTGLVGKVSLPDLVRDTSDIVERHFIEAALELTGGNRTSAAEVLGVSRQSLYVKLRRYGYEAKETGEG
jgi:transcriptional regulator PpsR